MDGARVENSSHNRRLDSAGTRGDDGYSATQFRRQQVERGVGMLDLEASLEAAKNGDERAFGQLVAPHRRELRAYCYRMAGSLADADDLLQESLLRAWRGLSAFEGRSSLRTWLYRVTWSACVDALESKTQRSLATDLGPAANLSDPMPAPRFDDWWVGPCPASLYIDDQPSPEARYNARESVGLAFLAALQPLPARQRAVLLARDVLGWSAEECATLMDSSVAAVNSALQRARETLHERAARYEPKLPDEPTTRSLLARYVHAWEQADARALAALLHEDATLSMPPFPFWLRGSHDICASIAAMVLTPDARGTFRFLETQANGMPALATYQKGTDGAFAAASLHVFSFDAGAIREITAFLEPRLVAAFELPLTL
jgi:RNA polymerase sigma-70 factor, ECF subfamily